jgi:hypothetical protein
MAVWQFVEDGVHPLAYSTPVFGPPWRVPMEFPSFQLAAFIPARLGMEIDSACRLTNIVFFYISALLLFLLCRTVVPGSRIADLSVIIFCWAPFTIYWSSQCLIDFAAVAFALGYTISLLCVIAFVGHTGLQEIFPKPKDFTLNEYRFARLLREITASDELVVIAERDWNPSILYHARRRGFMLRGRGFGNEHIDEREITRFLKTNGFSVVVTASENHWLTKKWLHSMALPSIPGYFVYRVSDQPISSGPNTTR